MFPFYFKKYRSFGKWNLYVFEQFSINLTVLPYYIYPDPIKGKKCIDVCLFGSDTDRIDSEIINSWNLPKSSVDRVPTYKFKMDQEWVSIYLKVIKILVLLHKKYINSMFTDISKQFQCPLKTNAQLEEFVDLILSGEYIPPPPFRDLMVKSLTNSPKYEELLKTEDNQKRVNIVSSCFPRIKFGKLLRSLDKG